MLLPLILFAVFTVMTVTGVYLIAAHHGSRRKAVAWASVVLLFFVFLLATVFRILRYAGP